MTPEEIRDEIKDILEDIAPDEDLEGLKDDVAFREQLELDSMDFLDIVMELRKRHRVQIPEEEEIIQLDICPEETLVLINSKTFTTAETILNAKSCKQWLINYYKSINIDDVNLITKSHLCACSTNIEETSKFGIS